MQVGPDYAHLFKRAEDFYRAGNYQGAVQVYSDLIDRYPKARAAYLRRGDCFASQRQFDKAIADFTTAIGLAPDDPRAYLARSWAYLGKGATERAMTDAEQRHSAGTDAGRGASDPGRGLRGRVSPTRPARRVAEALAVFYRRGVSSIAKRDYRLGSPTSNA